MPKPLASRALMSGQVAQGVRASPTDWSTRRMTGAVRLRVSREGRGRPFGHDLLAGSAVAMQRRPPLISFGAIVISSGVLASGLRRRALPTVHEPPAQRIDGCKPAEPSSATGTDMTHAYRSILRHGLALLLALCATHAQAGTVAPAEGLWRGEFTVNGEALPFNFELAGLEGAQPRLVLLNGSRRDEFEVEKLAGGGIRAVMNTYDAALEATVEEGSGG